MGEVGQDVLLSRQWSASASQHFRSCDIACFFLSCLPSRWQWYVHGVSMLRFTLFPRGLYHDLQRILMPCGHGLHNIFI